MVFYRIIEGRGDLRGDLPGGRNVPKRSNFVGFFDELCRAVIGHWSREGEKVTLQSFARHTRFTECLWLRVVRGALKKISISLTIP